VVRNPFDTVPCDTGFIADDGTALTGDAIE
jgi:hypothetical protein